MKAKTKPKYVIYFMNKKNQEQFIGVANLAAYNEFLFDLFRDSKIKTCAGFEYKDAVAMGFADQIQLTLLGAAKPKNKRK